VRWLQTFGDRAHQTRQERKLRKAHNATPYILLDVIGMAE